VAALTNGSCGKEDGEGWVMPMAVFGLVAVSPNDTDVETVAFL
jgi:hypothetical protein